MSAHGSSCSRRARSNPRAFSSTRERRNSRKVANSSGTVGKYITDTTGTDVAGYIPAMENHVTHNEDGAGGMHVYMPWWLDNKKLDFPRGYHIEVWGGVRSPARDSWAEFSDIRRAADTARSSRRITAAITARRSASRAAAR